MDSMNTKDLIQLGVPPGEPTRRGMELIARYILKGLDKSRLGDDVAAIVRDPAAFEDDELRGEFAKALIRSERPSREAPAAWRQWGEGLDPEAINQMGRACQLPIAVAGALMPDAHVGYGLPIGGVLATDNTVIPYAVGVDIACRMKLTVLDLPVRDIEKQRDKLIHAIETETRFGVGATFKQRRDHDVMDADWSVSRITVQNKDRAWTQLGTRSSIATSRDICAWTCSSMSRTTTTSPGRNGIASAASNAMWSFIGKARRPPQSECWGSFPVPWRRLDSLSAAKASPRPFNPPPTAPAA